MFKWMTNKNKTLNRSNFEQSFRIIHLSFNCYIKLGSWNTIFILINSSVVNTKMIY